ncbi:WW/Rsp5/WWP [Penicillium chermesinum]|uniref:WW/Rsp5/WWP n=1 Tax=Penicillium chermesinum TaxID=63820 RepID=A0A9W9NUL9_9EURO|nr:WW/Rsp5/WWP [Penicillium chermesinum]KAJ5226106.1 WW/Rsp5/WWP [Penicillium chermesinum]KAJ6160708.1 WW/Rsp5/WWP [Penicillium chermesinum]
MLNSTHRTLPPLPPGWSEHRAPTGHLYYYNAATKKSTYTRPHLSAPEATTPAPPVPPPLQAQSYNPETLPTYSSAPYGPAGYGHGDWQSGYEQRGAHTQGAGRGRGGFRGGKGYQDRGRREPQDRPKSKHTIPDCAPWVLVETKLGRRFVHNTETKESFWKFPQDVLAGVVEYDRRERERKERIERGEEPEPEGIEKATAPEKPSQNAIGEQENQQDEPRTGLGGEYDSDEYEEVEVTDSEGEGDEHPAKRARTESGSPHDQPVEFTEEDMEYQLAAMGEDYGLDPGEYGEPGGEDWEEAQGLPLTDEDAESLFRDLLDDYNINPFTTWEKIIEEGRIIDDSRYTAPSNMKTRREIFSKWSKDRIKTVQERKAKQEKQDPRIKYLAFLQEYASPKLYWPEFKRKYRKEPEMKDTQLHDRDREKLYRDYIAKLKTSESSRKSDLSALLKSTPLHALNRSSNLEALPPSIVTDVRYIALPPKTRDPLIEAYISTLAPPPEEQLTPEQLEELSRKRRDREKRERALAEREKRVEEDRRRQRGDLIRGKNLLKEGEAEIAEAMKVNKDGLRTHMELD